MVRFALTYDKQFLRRIHKDKNPFMDNLLKLGMEHPREYERLRSTRRLPVKVAEDAFDKAFGSPLLPRPLPHRSSLHRASAFCSCRVGGTENRACLSGFKTASAVG